MAEVVSAWIRVKSLLQDKSTAEHGKQVLQAAVHAFVEANGDPSTSANLRSNDPDPMAQILGILQHHCVCQNAALVLMLLKMVKVLTRKQGNRIQFTAGSIHQVLAVMVPALNEEVAAEGANVLLNVCYEPENVALLLRTPGVKQLVNFLLADNQDLQANAAGAIQSICYHQAGRAAICALDGMQSLLALLVSPNAKVVMRAAGAVHNLSTEAEAIRVIRQFGGILLLADLLHSEDEQVAGSAAGALQNVSREVASRMIIRELDVVEPLARLLSSQEVTVQVCASGALLNIMGPELQEEGGLASGTRDRQALGRLMSSAMAASIVYSSLFGARPDIV